MVLPVGGLAVVTCSLQGAVGVPGAYLKLLRCERHRHTEPKNISDRPQQDRARRIQLPTTGISKADQARGAQPRAGF